MAGGENSGVSSFRLHEDPKNLLRHRAAVAKRRSEEEKKKRGEEEAERSRVGKMCGGENGEEGGGDTVDSLNLGIKTKPVEDQLMDKQ
ncbi:hypothetical protein SODALDRAFT_329870 [Sodiomyces alkalinus F11]|uniref:IBB domain-containing protein n=1 Tax=Sodiomyces alkalinus (strain CBS 110278 / VKM F-3762 / F11) TaxID=1314773 RepID=A0A3N2Q0A2_SODAK|nr:hypothetical protein SODALDRAFT_329870 [Sodiomyces alkalinus F11]ROT40194.1 hypothetical protein SODALDRAFT_329870 [Sodiomyces alkalinus F11]